ncbi:MgtC/SapB family protein [Aquabacter cavernae]|uniref:MgtC/SapB family protein n=1 Tax=Aquabacter cavernae TaxID=2496029 RepID=UPI00196B596B|nr:MgtC/SapB family protein [Aquabacter cavernae]
MPFNPDWTDLGLRLVCAFLACLTIGLDREWQERAAGMRTTILVGLAACLAAMSANLMLATQGWQSQDFARMDVLRLPLGILTGMGFIGAGAIMRRADGLVQGVTTAATLWFVTVMCLCFGSGQLILGGLAWALALATLWGLKRVETWLHRWREATLTLTLGREGPSEEEIRQIIGQSRARIRRMFVRHEPASGRRDYRFTLWCAARPGEAPALVGALCTKPGVEQLDWDM